MLLAAPIAAASFDPVEKPSEFFLCGLAGSSLLPSALLLRVYLGWAYVGKRLLSAKVYYEEVRRARARARAFCEGPPFLAPVRRVRLPRRRFARAAALTHPPALTLAARRHRDRRGGTMARPS